jgi:hypothetical protein
VVAAAAVVAAVAGGDSLRVAGALSPDDEPPLDQRRIENKPRTAAMPSPTSQRRFPNLFLFPKSRSMSLSTAAGVGAFSSGGGLSLAGVGRGIASSANTTEGNASPGFCGGESGVAGTATANASGALGAIVAVSGARGAATAVGSGMLTTASACRGNGAGAATLGVGLVGGGDGSPAADRIRLGVMIGPGSGAVALLAGRAATATPPVPREGAARPAGGATPTIVLPIAGFAALTAAGSMDAAAGTAAPAERPEPVGAALTAPPGLGAVFGLVWGAGTAAFGATSGRWVACGCSAAGAAAGSSGSHEGRKRSARRSASSGETPPSLRAGGSVNFAPSRM